jgi:all-trans-retinol 13,14-reductase
MDVDDVNMDKQPIAISYRQHVIDDAWDAIVIGSGIGGLIAAAVLAKHAGKRVLVLERHYEPGGFTHVFHRPGYEWDVGVHYVGEVHDRRSEERRILDFLTAGALEWQRMPEVYDRVRIEDREYEFISGRERLRERLKGYFPAEGLAIDRYIEALLDAQRASLVYFAEKAIPAPIARLAGPMMRRGFLRYASRTTGEVLSGIGASPELSALLTAQWGNYGLPPDRSSFGMHAVVMASYLEGASYPVGGASRIAGALAPAIRGSGGLIVTSAEVAGIMLDGHGRAAGVRMADGRALRTELVVSDAGAANTFGRLLPADTPGLGEARATVENIGPSSSHLCLYAGLRGSPASLGLPAENLWVHRGDEMSFISFPSAKDPTFEARYPGRSTAEVVAQAPLAMFERWKDTRWQRRGAGYDEWKQRTTERLIGELERQVPAVRGRIDCAELSTPLTTRHFTNHPHGESYGLACTPARFQARCLRAATPIRGLYLTGADLITLGVTGALFGGMTAASAILGRDVTKAIAGRKTPLAAGTPAAA